MTDEIQLGELAYTAEDSDMAASPPGNYIFWKGDVLTRGPMISIERANEILREKLARAPYWCGGYDGESCWSSESVPATHEGRLVCLEEKK